MYSDHNHENHAYAEAVQPRLSLQNPPSSSSPISNSVINTVISNSVINTAISNMNTACSPTAHDGLQNVTTNTSLNTTSSIITTGIQIENDFHNSMGTAINSSSAGLLQLDGSTGSLTAGFPVTACSSAGGDQLQRNSGSPRVITENRTAAAELDGNSSKRKRDWMESSPLDGIGHGNHNIINQGKSSSSTSLLTSVRISNGLYSFPAGWEQYLDLQTGETYYVNWNTRTKHCRVQCPEVQRCLAGVQHNNNNNVNKLNSSTMNNKESVESWLSKMSATTSALVSNKPPKPPLPPPRSFKPSNKHPLHPTLDLTFKKLNSNPYTTLTSLLDTPSPPTTTHDPTFMPTPVRDFPYFNSSNDAIHSSTLSPNHKSYKNPTFDSACANLEVPSIAIDPLSYFCSNCNELVIMISSNNMMQCPNCNHAINKWSEDVTSPHCDMSLGALPLLDSSTKAKCQ